MQSYTKKLIREYIDFYRSMLVREWKYTYPDGSTEIKTTTQVIWD